MEKTTKNLNVAVNSDVYWNFKQEASKRGEKMPEAVENALRLYLSVTNTKEEFNDGNNA